MSRAVNVLRCSYGGGGGVKSIGFIGTGGLRYQGRKLRYLVLM